MNARYSAAAIFAVIALTCMPLLAHAQQLDTPNVGSVGAGHGKWIVEVTAGPSGAPDGFVVWWMKASDFAAANWTWFPSGNSIQASVYFDGQPTLNTMGGTLTDFRLGPNQTARIELGDLFDETGVYGNALGVKELNSSTEYVFCAWAIGSGSVSASYYSSNVYGTTTTNGSNCQFTQGYWKNHASAWPVNNLTLGSVNYTQAQLLSILNTPANGNGFLILAHQLIATKLNGALGADLSPVAGTIAAADAFIGANVIPPVGGATTATSNTSGWTQILDDFNNGIISTTCGPTDVTPTSWGRVKSLYR